MFPLAHAHMDGLTAAIWPGRFNRYSPFLPFVNDIFLNRPLRLQ
jgi:hypothetical protein